MLLLVLAPAAGFATIDLIVDSTVDSGDEIPGDGDCESVLGGCTLRAAIDEANALAPAPDELTVILPAGTYTLSLAGALENANATGDLDIDCNLVIQGAGQGVSIIDGGGFDRVLDVRKNIPDLWQVELRDLTITGGALPAGAESWFGDGGGIRTWAHLTLRRASVSGNHASHGRDAEIAGDGDLIHDAEVGGAGGGIYNAGTGSTLSLIDSIVSGNSSGHGGDATVWVDEFDNAHIKGTAKNGGPGGGIAASAATTTTLLRTQVTGNHTGDGGTDHTPADTNPGEGGSGGGISTDLATLVELTESSVSGNWTGKGGERSLLASQTGRCIEDEDPWDYDCPSGIGGQGGGIHLRGGTLTLTDSTVADNWTGTSGPWCGVCMPGGPGEGGGVFAWGQPAVSIARSTVSGNISGKTGTGGYETDGKSGGLHIQLDDTHPLTIVSSTFSGNKAYVAGGLHIVTDIGGTGSILDTTITANHAWLAGGIQWIADSRDGDLLEIGNSILAGNTATTTNPDCWTFFPDEFGLITSIDYNLLGDVSDCAFPLEDHDTVGGASHHLEPLADNGGPTLTHMPGSGSLATDLGGNCQSVDQRGLTRFTGTACDRGSVEVGVLPPTVVTGAASEVTETSATLNGSADPNGDSTTAAFDYGPTDSYGTAVALGSIGSGSDPAPLSTDLTGLSCSATYHFRARATNSGGTTNGDDQVFMTGTCSGGPPNSLTLSNLTIDGDPGEDLYEACNDITAGPNVHVTASAGTLLRAFGWLALGESFTVDEGCSLTLDLSKPAGCP